MKGLVLLVDDDRPRAEMIAQGLGPDLRCAIAGSADAALRMLLVEEPAAVLADFDLGTDGTGLTVLRGAELFRSRSVRMLYSRFYCDGLVQVARQLGRAQAVLDARDAGFLADLRRTLAELLRRPPRADVPAAADELERRWCALAPASRRFVAELREAAKSTRPVFAHGEPGTGKRLAQETLLAWRDAWQAAGGRAGVESAVPAVHVLAIPPLRERADDVPALCARVLERLAAEMPSCPTALSDEALAGLAGRDWWGNVAELQSVLCRAWERARRGGRTLIGPADVPTDIEPRPTILDRAETEGRREAMLIELRATGSVRKAAALDGHTRPNYKRWMNRYGILRLDRTATPAPGA